MTIDLLPKDGFPYGNNIHFVFNLRLGELAYVHPSIGWAALAESGHSVPALLAQIESEDVPQLKEVLSQVVGQTFSGSIHLRLLIAGTYRWLQITPHLVRHDGDDVIIGTAIEITGEMENNQTLQKYANKKNSILYMLGHDLRGPLNVAKSVITLLDRELTDPTILNRTGYIASVLQQAIDLINDLINREFLETTEIVLLKKQVDIVAKLREYLDECRRSSDLAERTFKLSSSSDKIFILLDHNKFMQVVNNLISNSLKYTHPGGTISVDVTEAGSYLLFKFTDDGIGIPESLMPNIFDQFTDARRPGLHGEPTIGLGLSIVKTIIEWHQGQIWCESKEGEGTTFYIRLPREQQ
jgi:two-component system sensor histidine kinase VicK